MAKHSVQPKRRQRGVTLLEVLVSVTVLVLGVLGLAALQARSLMMGQSAYYRSIAADLATDLSERIQANRSPFLASSGSDAQPGLPPDFSDDSCTKDTAGVFTCTTPSGHQSYLAASELTEWYASLTTQLPGGRYRLDKETSASASRYMYTLTIFWTDDRSQSSSEGSYPVVIE